MHIEQLAPCLAHTKQAIHDKLLVTCLELSLARSKYLGVLSFIVYELSSLNMHPVFFRT